LPDVGWTATADPTGGSFSSISAASTSTSQHVLVTVSLTNVTVNMNLSGNVGIATYSTPASAKADVTLKYQVKFFVPTLGPDKGKLLTSTTAEFVTISNVSLDLGTTPSLIDGFVSTLVNSVLNGFVQNQLNTYVLSAVDTSVVDLEFLDTTFTVPLEKDYSQTNVFTLAEHSSLGVTAYAESDLTPGSAPTGPALEFYDAGEGPLATFGSTVPGTGGPYHWAVGMRIDALNSLLAKLAKGGFANGDYDALASQLGLDFGAIPFTAAELAVWLPTAGFERLPPSQIVTVILSPKLAPFVKGDPLEAELTSELAGVKARFVTQAPGSQFDVELLTLELYSKAVLKVEKASQKKLELSVESTLEKSKIVKGMPTAKQPAARSGGEKFSEILTPLVLRGLQNLSLPGYEMAGGYAGSVQLKTGPLDGIPTGRTEPPIAGWASWNKFQ
jgi:hypothetical protein